MEETKKRKGISFKIRLLGMVFVPMFALAVILEVMSMRSMLQLGGAEAKNQLTAYADSTVARYDAINDKNYSYCGNGMMKGAIQLSENYSVMDALKESTEIDTTLYWDTQRVASTLMDEAGNRMVGTKLYNEEIIDTVLKKGEVYYTTNISIGGEAYFGVYSPLKQPNSEEVIGMIFAGKPKADVEAQLISSLIFQLVATIILFLIMMVVSYLTANRIAAALVHSKVEINKISDGVLDYANKASYEARNDEIGSVIHATRNVVAKLSKIIGNIVTSSKMLEECSGKFQVAFDNMNQNFGNINTAVEEIARGATNQAMETQNANQGVQQIGNAIDETMSQVEVLSSSTVKMTDYNKSVQGTIDGLARINNHTKESVVEVYEQTNATNSSANEIRSATELITSIASQTNLLSLNASIEAARAGEMGKGFAVVADEIRKLSEQSREAAEQIGSIVEGLLANSNRSVNTMNEMTEIIEKQNGMIEETKQAFDGLNEEANSVSLAVDQIEDRIRTLGDLKDQVYSTVENLASIAEENAASTEETSASMMELDKTLGECDEVTKEMIQIAEQLEQQINIFSFASDSKLPQ